MFWHYLCVSGIAYVGFKTEKDLDQALRRNKNFIGGKRVFLKTAETEEVEPVEAESPRPWELKVSELSCFRNVQQGCNFNVPLLYQGTEIPLVDSCKFVMQFSNFHHTM